MPSSFDSYENSYPTRKNKQGRPTKHVQLSIYQLMQKCFEDGITAPSAAKLIKVNDKTAYRYYDEITKKYVEQNYDDMLKREESGRAQMMSTFDNDILELTGLLDDVRGQIQACKSTGNAIPPVLIGQALSIIRTRHVVKEKKFAYGIRPTLKELSKPEGEIK